MADGKGSVLTIALAEQKRKDDSVSFVQEKKSNISLVALGVLFFFMALCVLGYVGYTKYTERTALLKLAEKNTLSGGIIETDKIISVDITKLLPKNGITKSLLYNIGGAILSTNTIDVVVPVNPSNDGIITKSDGQTVLARLMPHAPNILKRSISGDITIGVYGGDSAVPFVLFKTNSYEGTFSGLLEWEKFMSDDLFVFMNVLLPENKAPESPAINTVLLDSTSTPATSTERVPVNRDINLFIDRTIKNKDMRVLQDDAGKIYFLYGFVDKNTVIITTNPETFFEVSSRLR